MKYNATIEPFRFRSGPWGSSTGEIDGAFEIPGPCGRMLRVIASSGDSSLGIEWEHVSVSLPTRCPNWPEMDFVKRLFWDDEETVMQLHPPRSMWVNQHEYCLHMWKPLAATIPLPPIETVGIQ